MKKSLSKEVIRYGAAAATLVGLGAAAMWAFTRPQRREPKPQPGLRMSLRWDRLQGEPEYPATIASIDPALPDEGDVQRAFAALYVRPDDLPEGWKDTELHIVRKPGKYSWQTASTGHTMGELAAPSHESFGGILLPLGVSGLRAFLAHRQDGELIGMPTGVAEIVPPDFLNNHYVQVPAVYAG